MRMIRKIIFGTGCFWCSEAAFQLIKGVTKVTPGYSGGWVENPSYEQVCTGTTGHVETVFLEYDNSQVSLEELLEVFLMIHDPTSWDRQGNDVGEQYRSVIFFFEDEDEKIINDFLKRQQNRFIKPIVTVVSKAKNFYPAENYHMKYYERNRDKPYCKYVIAPKISKVMSHTELINPAQLNQ